MADGVLKKGVDSGALTNYRALPREERLAVLAAMMAVEAEDAAGSG